MSWFSNNFRTIGMLLTDGIIIIPLLLLCFYIATNDKGEIDKISLTINLGTLISGAAVGWLVGFLITPYTDDEEEKFSSVSKAISVFASGYLIAKIDKAVERMLSPENLFQAIVAFRGMTFVAAFIVALLTTYISRRYIGGKFVDKLNRAAKQ
jgi:hypothetical protein